MLELMKADSEAAAQEKAIQNDNSQLIV